MKRPLVVLLAAVAIAGPACPPPPPPPPPPAGAALTGTAAGIMAFTATVTTIGPPTWTYAVASPAPGTAGGPFVFRGVEVITSIDVTRCTFQPPPAPTTWRVDTLPDGTPVGFVDTAPASVPGTLTLSFSITCRDRASGPIYLKVNRGPGTIARTIGPIAGPV